MFLALPLLLSQYRNTTIPAGTNSAFQHTCVAVSESLQAGDFAKASHLVELMPKAEVTVGWNDSSVPEDLRRSFAAARDKVLAFYVKAVPDISFKISPHGDVEFNLVDQLGTNPDTKLPRGTEIKFGETPRALVNVGIHRGANLEVIGDGDIMNAVAHGVGSYLGVLESPYQLTAMHDSDLGQQQFLGITNAEATVAYRAQLLSAHLRKSVAEKRVVKFALPQVKVSLERFEAGQVLQGTKIPVKFEVDNTGKGNLAYRLQPDCGCFSPVQPGELEPGTGRFLRFMMDTTAFTGEHLKRLVLYTNDPDRPSIELPFHVKITPAFRFFRPTGNTIILPNGGSAIDAFLFFPNGHAIEPETATLDGLPGTVTVLPWSGPLADPEMGEGALARKGYRVRVRLDQSNLPPGQCPATISLTSSDPVFRYMRYTIYVQKGIVASPESLVLGELGSRPTKGLTFSVSRPGKPFKVKGVKSAVANITATVLPSASNDQYNIQWFYDGKAAVGDLSGDIIVLTDDPSQPEIHVPVSASVSR